MKQVILQLRNKFKTLNIPLRFKLIVGFTIIVILTGSISIISYVSLKNSIKKLNMLITATITANDIIEPAGKVPTNITNYFIDKQGVEKQTILNNLAIIKNKIKLLYQQVKDENGLDELTNLDNLTQSYTEIIAETIHVIENRQFGEGISEQSDDIRKEFGFIKDSVQQLICSCQYII